MEKTTTGTMPPPSDGAGSHDEQVWVSTMVPRSLAQASLEAAESNSTSRSAVMRQALEQYIDGAEKKSGGWA